MLFQTAAISGSFRVCLPILQFFLYIITQFTVGIFRERERDVHSFSVSTIVKLKNHCFLTS